MRVLHLSKTPHGAGWAVHQVRELVRLGIDVHVAVPGGGPMPDRFAAGGATVHLVDVGFPASAPHEVPAARRRLRELVAAVDPDVIHSHFVSTTLTMRLALGRRHPVPRVFQVAGPLHLEQGWSRHAELATAGPHDHWIASCRWVQERYLRSGIDADRVWLSYLGTDVDAFTASPTGVLREELGVAADRPLVGIVAYMYAPKRYLGQRRGLKGHEDLIEAVGRIVTRHPDVLLVVVGAAWNGRSDYEERVRAAARDRLGERAVFLGHRTDVPRIYPDLDVAVHPSLSENVGGAVESLLSGVPTIASDVGGLPDVVLPGSTGWLVPAADPKALAGALDEALGDPAEARRRAQHGRALVAELFDVRTTAKQVAGIYEQLAGRAQ